MTTKHFLVAAMLICLCACNKKSISLEGDWQLSEIPDFNIDDLSEIPKLSFITQDSTYSGYTGCNNFHGNITFSESKITFGPGPMTRAYCDDKGLEASFLNLLFSSSEFHIDGNELELSDGSNKLLTFQKIEVAN